MNSERQSFSPIDTERFLRIKQAAQTQFGIILLGTQGVEKFKGVKFSFGYDPAAHTLTVQLLAIPKVLGIPIISEASANQKLSDWITGTL